MAKKKQKSAGLPKRFAGVKIPKKVRKGPVGDFLTSPAGRLVVAEVVTAAGALLAKRSLDQNPESKRALRRKAAKAGDAAAGAAHAVEHTGSNLALAMTEAARTFGRVLHHGDAPEAAPALLQPAPDAVPAPPGPQH